MKSFFALLIVAFLSIALAVDEYAGVKVMYADIDPYHEGAPGPWDGKQGVHVPVLKINEAAVRQHKRDVAYTNHKRFTHKS
mmetsp:Transcript_39894/g.67890  ORF Transcript_39894/g.67890 Transcript_39894/m.67890 type:complete len:81 (-) Transcript_39894:416-658(-)